MLRSNLPDARQDAYRLQEEAVEAYLNGTALDRARIGTRAAIDLLRGLGKNIEKMFAFTLMVNRGQYERLIADQFLHDPDGTWLLQHQPDLGTHYKMRIAGELRALPEGTLGREFVRMLDQDGLLYRDIDTKVPAGIPPMIRFVIERLRETHDMFHLICQYGTDIQGEVELQAFVAGNCGALRSAVLAAVTGAVQYVKLRPDMPLLVARAYRRGRRAAPMLPVRWELLWDRQLSDIRSQFRL